MAIVLAVQKWKHYLLGQHFIVCTDRRSLKYLLEQHIIPAEFQRRVTKLMGYEFDIKYRPGLENRATDALSRISSPVELSALTIPEMLDVQKISAQVDGDPLLSKLKQELQANPDSHPRYSLEQGRLLFKGRSVLPRSSSMIPAVLSEFHSSLLGGHLVFLRTYKRLTSSFPHIMMPT